MATHEEGVWQIFSERETGTLGADAFFALPASHFSFTLPGRFIEEITHDEVV